jgi:YfiH family protein
MFFIREKNGFRYAGFERFNDRSMVSGFSVKTAMDDPLNFALHTGDDPSKVLSSRKRFFPLFSIDPLRIVSPLQVHGDAILTPGPQDKGLGAKTCQGLPEADAVILTRPGIPAMILTADCIPFQIRVLDRPLGGLVHSGWKGAQKGILAKVVKTFIMKHSADPARILIAAGPHIRPCCYEVQDDFRQNFDNAFFVESGGRTRFDLLKASLKGVEELGILRKHIFDSGFALPATRNISLLTAGTGPATGWPPF